VTAPTSPAGAGGAGRPPGESKLAERLLRRLGSPGLIESAVVQDAVRRRLERSGRLFPVVERLLARAAEDGAGEFAGAAMPLAGPFGFDADDPVPRPQGTTAAPQMSSMPLPLPAEGAPGRLLRVSRRGRMAEARPALPIPGMGRSGADPATGSSAFGPALSLAASQENRTTLRTGMMPRRADETHSAGEAPAVRVKPLPLAEVPSPSTAAVSEVAPRHAADMRGGADRGVRDTPLPFAGAPPPLPVAETGGGPEHAAIRNAAPVPGGAPESPTETIGSPGRRMDRGSPPLSRAGSLPRVTGRRPLEPEMPVRAAIGALSRVPELRVPRPGSREEAVGARSAEAILSSAPNANQVQKTPTMLVSELRRPTERRPREIGTNEVPIGSRELPRSARPPARLVLPSAFAEARRRAAGSGPAASLTSETNAPGPGLVTPNPVMRIAPRPAVPSAAPLAGAELERLADKVGRIIARRVAVERERRGR
jgi:hypothetical protein